MDKNNFKWLPETLVYITFMLMGIFFGFVIHYFGINQTSLHSYEHIGLFPYLVGVGSALLTGFVCFRLKLHYKQIKFEHFYLLIVGVVALLNSGLFIFSEDLKIATYLGFMGHGICYVAGLSYVNIRILKTRYRFILLSIPHVMYLTGVGIASIIIFIPKDHSENMKILATMGGTVSFLAFVLLGLYITVEVMQYNERCNYKCSLDEDIQLENSNLSIFDHKYFPFGDDPNNELFKIDPFDLQTEYSHILFACFTKVISIMHFYYPLFMIFRYISHDGKLYMVLNWVGVLGQLTSMALIPFMKYKTHFVSACAFKVITLLVFIGVFTEMDEVDELQSFIGFFFVSAYGYSFPDINILSFANLKYNELALVLGYIMEILIVAVMQYSIMHDPKFMLNFSNNINLLLPHALIFIILIFVIGVMGIFKIPNGSLKKSLFELKNNLYNEKIIVREYHQISYQNSDSTSQAHLFVSPSIDEEYEHHQADRNHLYREQQLVVQKHVNHVLDEQESGGSCSKSHAITNSNKMPSYQDQQLIVQKNANCILDEQEVDTGDSVQSSNKKSSSEDFTIYPSQTKPIGITTAVNNKSCDHANNQLFLDQQLIVQKQANLALDEQTGDGYYRDNTQNLANKLEGSVESFNYNVMD